GASLVGFHTTSYAENFLAACRRLLGATVERDGRGRLLGRVIWEGRAVKVGAFPIGIDIDAFEGTAASREARTMAAHFKRDFRDEHLVLGVDRLDYTKGLNERVQAFGSFLERHPRFRRKVSLIQVAVPSRTRVEEYRQMKRELDETVGRSNGRFREPGWTPV